MKTMTALFTDESYKAIQNGAAVFNNGFRSKNGNYWPEQPNFVPQKGRSPLAQFCINLAKDAGTALVLDLVLPATEKIVLETFIPSWQKRFNDKEEAKAAKKATPVSDTPSTDNTEVIDFSKYRKMA